MTDISKEAVGRIIRWVEKRLPGSDEDAVDLIRALQARVSELEYEQSTDFDMGRVQGLDEAVEAVRKHFIHGPSAFNGEGERLAESIEALKEQTND